MSGREFVSTLGLLGYPRVKALDSASLDWLFEDHMAPFLSWFCHSLTAANVLSEEELQQFAALQESGEGLLSGDQLENVLQTLNPFPDDATPVTKASLKDEISRLAEDVKTYQLRKDTLIQQRNQLSTHLTQQTKAASQADSCQAAGKQEYREALEQSQADNNTRNESDLRLVKCVNAISGLYEKSAQQQQQDEAVFLSQLELKNLQKLEEKYSQEVTNYSKKQFFEGIAEMTGQTEGSRYEMLEISDPKCLLLQGETSEKNIKYSRELARLKNIYPHSEQLRIESAVGKARHKSANEEAETVLRSLQAKPMSDSAHSLSAQLEELQSGQQTVKRDIADQTEDIIPGLIMQNAASQVLPIITGDYNLKIARQDYFTSNQDQLIGQLVVQRARNEFLSMAYEVESRNHRDVHRLLTAVHSQLCSQETALQQRLELMEDPGLTTAKYQRGTIDSRDGSAQRLHAVLVPNPDDDHALYQKFASLVRGAEQLCDQSSSTQASLATVFTQHKEHLVQLQRLLAQCEGLVYSESSGSVGQPVLTPQPLLTAHTTLSRILTQIEQTVMDVIKQVDQKKKVLRGDPLVRTEREIMEMFLVTPEKLGALLEQMTQRIQAQRVK